MFDRLWYRSLRWGIGLIVLLSLLTGCGSPQPVATPTPTRTAMPAATATSAPTLAPPTQVPTFTPSPQPVVEAGTPLPPDVNPFTGQKVADVALLNRRPIAIKVSNSPEARPQSGLGAAELVFEHYAEGNITRYTTVFYANEPQNVGSVRSGRLIDLEIPAMFGALFGYSGSSAGVKNRIRNSDLFPERIAAPDFGVGEPYFYRVPQEGKAFEHTLFSNPAVLRQLAEERGVNQRPVFTYTWSFSEAVPAGVKPVTYLEVNYLPRVCTAEWTYDPASGKWDRSIAGTVHTDFSTGEQIAASNVILLYANHLETDIQEDTAGGGHMSIEIQVWGSGSLLLFRDGQMVQGYWERTQRHEMPRFTNGEGKPLLLKPGNTWFQLIPLDTAAEEFQTGMWRFIP